MVRFGKAFFFFGLLLGSAPAVYACTCLPPGTPTEERDASDLVFSGKVVRIDTVMVDIGGGMMYPWLNVAFRVDRTWKGSDSSAVEILTAVNSGLCGYHFEVGERYLVYANVFGDYNMPETSICTRTRAFSNAAEDLMELGEGTPVRVETEEPPRSFSLAQNYPNPFNPSTRIAYELEQPAFVALHVYDLQGRLLRTLVNSFKGNREHGVTFEAGALPSGVYLYELIVGAGIERKFMILAR